MNRFLFLISMLNLIVSGSEAQVENANPKTFYGYADILILEGVITVDDKSSKNFKAELFLESYRIEEKDCGKTFSFKLKRNSHYTLKISKEGHLSRSISISTIIPEYLEEEDKRIFTYEVGVELPVKTGLENEFYTDFPIAIINYDAGIGTFVYNKKYTDHIKNQIVTSDGAPKDTIKLNYNYQPKSVEEAEKLLEEGDGKIDPADLSTDSEISEPKKD